MRHAEEKPHGHQSAQKWHHKEAVQAFAYPQKIDDSWLGSLDLRMPNFVEKHPKFFAFFFVGSSLLFLLGVCFNVQYQDYKEARVRTRLMDQRRQAIAEARALLQAPHRMGSSFSMGGNRVPTTAELRAETEAAVDDEVTVQQWAGQSMTTAAETLAKRPRDAAAAAVRNVQIS